MAKFFILVADQSHARLYQGTSLRGPLTELEDFSNKVAHCHERDLVSDAPGRSSSPGNAYSHPLGRENEARDHALQLFAKTISDELSHVLYNKADARLYVLAPPKFLGVLRKQFDQTVNEALVATLDKEITDYSAVDVLAHVQSLEPLS